MTQDSGFGSRELETALDVSRETLERLDTYYILLCRWQKAINLVSRGSMENAWKRHFLDSGQLLAHIPSGASSLLDIGSGAGFPGLVLAILGVKNVHLVEADQRKCLFLSEVSRETSAEVRVVNERIENFPSKSFDVVTSRACAPLEVLLKYTQPYLGPRSIGLFLKGRSVEDELTTAKKRWDIRYSLISSISDSAGKIVRLEGISDGRTATD
jgi:16S rRNA (guanine527-N7)-methyltransferase